MRELAKRRLTANFKQSLKYLSLVFNDFFVLALIFLFGALMFWYAQNMKYWPVDLWFYRGLVGAILWLPLLSGRLVTLLQNADSKFLITQDEHMREYLRPMLRYSLLLPVMLLLFLSGILFPFALIKAKLGFNYWLLVASVLVIKILQLILQKSRLYFARPLAAGLFNFLALLVLVLGAYSPVVLILGVAILAALIWQNAKTKQANFDWRYAISDEAARKEQVYSLYSMFTDVKEKTPVIKRRKYLDVLLPRTLAKETANKFLYRRTLLRNPQNLNLLVRMTVFAVLISWLVQDWRWALGLAALVVFLTVYQLLPVASEFDANIMYRVAPIDKTKRGQDLVKVITGAVILQWLVISLGWLLVLPFSKWLLLGSGLLLAAAALVTLIYLPYKVRSREK